VIPTVAVSPIGDITSFLTDTVFESFDVYDIHTFQVIWNKLTIIGPAWKESNNLMVNNAVSNVVHCRNRCCSLQHIAVHLCSTCSMTVLWILIRKAKKRL
jgi:hypothetical protein